MDVPQLRLGTVQLPGVAGELQKQGATASLVRELGDNYETYHTFLAERLVKLGGRPDPSKYKSYDPYAASWTQVEDVVHAEVTLRACRGFRRFGTALDSLPETPLVDESDRLVADKS
jgi:hypothetical protein